MPSTYSTSLGLELIGNGEQAGTWGTTTNNNLGTLLEAAITGVQPITLTGGDYTLTDYNGLPDEARNAVLVLGGLLGAPCNVIAPAVEKTYIVRNFSNASVTIKTASGNGVVLTNAASAVVFCDGTDFYSATTLNYIDGNLTVTGNASVYGSVSMANTAGATVTIGANNIYANSSTGQLWLPKGNTAVRTSSPIEGILRYNTEAKFYEGYANGSWIRFIVANQGSYTINYVAVGGGAGGGPNGLRVPGGGGAGKVIISTTPAIPGTTVINITIGAGGAAGTSGTGTVITGIADAVTGQPGSLNGGSSGNGYSGGAGFSNEGENTAGGGGAGAGAVGGAASNNPSGGNGGAGGIGLETLITGTSQYFGGGGGGWGANGSGAGGAGGGGAGGVGAAAGTNGTTNTGGGGGGAASGVTGGSGGSGIVYLSMLTEYYTGVYTGSPSITTTGGYTVLRYTGSGSYTA